MSQSYLPHSHGQKILEFISKLPDTQSFYTISELFQILSDGSRIRIFWILCHCEECVINISAIMEMSSPAVSHHLKLLKTNDLITSRRSGKEMYYKAADTEKAKLLHNIIEQLIHISCPVSK